MGPQEDYIETIVTCEGDFYDPGFHDSLNDFSQRLQDLIATADHRKLVVKKVEPWNSVRVTFNIPKEAAVRLKQLAEQGDQTLKELGVLAVQIEGDRLISLTIAGKNNETTELVLRTEPMAASGGNQFDVPSADEMNMPGPSQVESTRNNIIKYLQEGGPGNLFESLFNPGAMLDNFKPPDAVGAAISQEFLLGRKNHPPFPFDKPGFGSMPGTSHSPGHSNNLPEHLSLPPGLANSFQSPSLARTRAFSSPTTSHNQSPMSPNYPTPPPSVSNPSSPGLRTHHFPVSLPGTSSAAVLNNLPRGLAGTRDITSSSPLLVNLLQNDVGGFGHLNNLIPQKMQGFPMPFPPMDLGPPSQAPKRKRKPRKPKDGSAKLSKVPAGQGLSLAMPGFSPQVSEGVSESDPLSMHTVVSKPPSEGSSATAVGNHNQESSKSPISASPCTPLPSAGKTTPPMTDSMRQQSLPKTAYSPGMASPIQANSPVRLSAAPRAGSPARSPAISIGGRLQQMVNPVTGQLEPAINSEHRQGNKIWREGFMDTDEMDQVQLKPPPNPLVVLQSNMSSPGGISVKTVPASSLMKSSPAITDSLSKQANTELENSSNSQSVPNLTIPPLQIPLPVSTSPFLGHPDSVSKLSSTAELVNKNPIAATVQHTMQTFPFICGASSIPGSVPGLKSVLSAPRMSLGITNMGSTAVSANLTLGSNSPSHHTAPSSLAASHNNDLHVSLSSYSTLPPIVTVHNSAPNRTSTTTDSSRSSAVSVQGVISISSASTLAMGRMSTTSTMLVTAATTGATFVGPLLTSSNVAITSVLTSACSVTPGVSTNNIVPDLSGNLIAQSNITHTEPVRTSMVDSSLVKSITSVVSSVSDQMQNSGPKSPLRGSEERNESLENRIPTTDSLSVNSVPLQSTDQVNTCEASAGAPVGVHASQRTESPSAPSSDPASDTVLLLREGNESNSPHYNCLSHDPSETVLSGATPEHEQCPTDVSDSSSIVAPNSQGKDSGIADVAREPVLPKMNCLNKTDGTRIDTTDLSRSNGASTSEASPLSEADTVSSGHLSHSPSVRSSSAGGVNHDSELSSHSFDDHNCTVSHDGIVNSEAKFSANSHGSVKGNVDDNQSVKSDLHKCVTSASDTNVITVGYALSKDQPMVNLSQSGLSDKNLPFLTKPSNPFTKDINDVCLKGYCNSQHLNSIRSLKAEGMIQIDGSNSKKAHQGLNNGGMDATDYLNWSRTLNLHPKLLGKSDLNPGGDLGLKNTLQSRVSVSDEDHSFNGEVSKLHFQLATTQSLGIDLKESKHVGEQESQSIKNNNIPLSTLSAHPSMEDGSSLNNAQNTIYDAQHRTVRIPIPEKPDLHPNNDSSTRMEYDDESTAQHEQDDDSSVDVHAQTADQHVHQSAVDTDIVSDETNPQSPIRPNVQQESVSVSSPHVTCIVDTLCAVDRARQEMDHKPDVVPCSTPNDIVLQAMNSKSPPSTVDSSSLSVTEQSQVLTPQLIATTSQISKHLLSNSCNLISGHASASESQRINVTLSSTYGASMVSTVLNSTVSMNSAVTVTSFSSLGAQSDSAMPPTSTSIPDTLCTTRVSPSVSTAGIHTSGSSSNTVIPSTTCVSSSSVIPTSTQHVSILQHKSLNVQDTCISQPLTTSPSSLLSQQSQVSHSLSSLAETAAISATPSVSYFSEETESLDQLSASSVGVDIPPFGHELRVDSCSSPDKSLEQETESSMKEPLSCAETSQPNESSPTSVAIPNMTVSSITQCAEETQLKEPDSSLVRSQVPAVSSSVDISQSNITVHSESPLGGDSSCIVTDEDDKIIAKEKQSSDQLQEKTDAKPSRGISIMKPLYDREFEIEEELQPVSRTPVETNLNKTKPELAGDNSSNTNTSGPASKSKAPFTVAQILEQADKRRIQAKQKIIQLPPSSNCIVPESTLLNDSAVNLTAVRTAIKAPIVSSITPIKAAIPAVDFSRNVGGHIINFIEKSLHTPVLFNSTPHPITSPGFPLNLTESVQKVMSVIPRTDTTPPPSPTPTQLTTSFPASLSMPHITPSSPVLEIGLSQHSAHSLGMPVSLLHVTTPVVSTRVTSCVTTLPSTATESTSHQTSPDTLPCETESTTVNIEAAIDTNKQLESEANTSVVEVVGSPSQKPEVLVTADYIPSVVESDEGIQGVGERLVNNQANDPDSRETSPDSTEKLVDPAGLCEHSYSAKPPDTGKSLVKPTNRGTPDDTSTQDCSLDISDGEKPSQKLPILAEDSVNSGVHTTTVATNENTLINVQNDTSCSETNLLPNDSHLSPVLEEPLLDQEVSGINATTDHTNELLPVSKTLDIRPSSQVEKTSSPVFVKLPTEQTSPKTVDVSPVNKAVILSPVLKSTSPTESSDSGRTLVIKIVGAHHAGNDTKHPPIPPGTHFSTRESNIIDLSGLANAQRMTQHEISSKTFHRGLKRKSPVDPIIKQNIIHTQIADKIKSEPVEHPLVPVTPIEENLGNIIPKRSPSLDTMSETSSIDTPISRGQRGSSTERSESPVPKLARMSTRNNGRRHNSSSESSSVDGVTSKDGISSLCSSKPAQTRGNKRRLTSSTEEDIAPLDKKIKVEPMVESLDNDHELEHVVDDGSKSTAKSTKMNKRVPTPPLEDDIAKVKKYDKVSNKVTEKGSYKEAARNLKGKSASDNTTEAGLPEIEYETLSELPDKLKAGTVRPKTYSKADAKDASIREGILDAKGKRTTRSQKSKEHCELPNAIQPKKRRTSKDAR